eukprot:361933-Prorocentrum_minimum.AAC.1
MLQICPFVLEIRPFVLETPPPSVSNPPPLAARIPRASFLAPRPIGRWTRLPIEGRRRFERDCRISGVRAGPSDQRRSSGTVGLTDPVGLIRGCRGVLD